MAECALLPLPDRAPMSTSVAPGNKPCLDVSHIEDLQLAASKLLGSHRRSFQAAMAVKYCQGNPRPKPSRCLAGAVIPWRWDCMSGAPGSSAWVRNRPVVAIALGGAPPRGGRGSVRTGRDSFPARPDLPHHPLLHPPDRGSSPPAVARLGQSPRRLCPRPAPWRRCSIATVTGCGRCSRNVGEIGWPLLALEIAPLVQMA